MAEINLANVPITPYDQFNNNDKFIIINDGSTQQLSRSDVLRWVRDNVKGDKGDQGVSGKDGKDGVDGTDGISATHRWNGTTLTVTSASGVSSANLKGEIGSIGRSGSDGSDGWTPQLSLEPRGDDSVLKVTDWIGGTGTKPLTNVYLGTSGFVSTISQAVNIRGLRGAQGVKGETGSQGDKGSDGSTVTSVEYSDTNEILLTTNTGVISSSIPKNTQTGYGLYSDTKYTSVQPLAITQDTETLLLNNGSTQAENLPHNALSMYLPIDNKLLFHDLSGVYTIRLRFNYKDATAASITHVRLSDQTTNPVFLNLHTKPSGQIDGFFDETFITTVTPEMIANGAVVFVRTTSANMTIHNISYLITKVV